MGYMKNFETELKSKIVKRLNKMLLEGDGDADITMKKDDKKWHIMECIDKKYVVSHTTYTNHHEVESTERKVFNSLEDIAEWMMKY